LFLYTKNQQNYTKNKKEEIQNFNNENEYFFDTTILRNNINFYYPENKIEFEE